ncbi:MAG: hypothetical protein SGILL_007732, partial [Bacillariaceae sp.]
AVAIEFKSTIIATKEYSVYNTERFRAVKTEAMAQGLVQIGHRRIHTTGSGDDIEVVSRHSDMSGLTLEQYLRLTEKGHNSMKQVIETALVKVKLTGLPEEVEINDLVTFFETEHDCPIQRACLGAVDDPSGSAHIEFLSAQDASKILKLGSSWDGLMFRDKSVAATQANEAPLADKVDPSRIYEAARPDAVPTTISTLDQSMDIESMSLRSGVTAQTNLTDYSDYDPVSLFCRVIHDQIPSETIEGDTSMLMTRWNSTGKIGADFQKLYTGSKDEQKGRFQKARTQVIAEGLVEMGRRVLDSESREIVSVPFFNGQTPTVAGLSNEKENELTRESTDTSDLAESIDNASNRPTETEEADLITDEKELETLATTDLLYGDNLALLYAQSAPKQTSNVMDCDGAAQSFHGVDETKEENIGLTRKAFGGDETVELYGSLDNKAFEIPVDNSLFLGAEVAQENKEMAQETNTLTGTPTFTNDNAGGFPADPKTEELVDEIGAMAKSLDLLLS